MLYGLAIADALTSRPNGRKADFRSIWAKGGRSHAIVNRTEHRNVESSRILWTDQEGLHLDPPRPRLGHPA
jgi:hypothetical protein